MSRIRSKDTTAELILRRELWRNQFRYRLHYKGLIGKPDIVFPKYKVVIFVDGRFWHGYNWNKQKTKLLKNNNGEYWVSKIEKNMKRDKNVRRQLITAGWTVLRFWEHDILNNLTNCIAKVAMTVDEANYKEI